MATSQGQRTHVPARLHPDGVPPPTSVGAYEDRLPRQLGFWGTTALTVGLIVGSGIFRVPGAIAADSGSVGRIAFVWIAGGAIALCGALSLAELGAMFPRSGGIYIFLREAYGPPVAFLWGWTALVVLPASGAALSLFFAEYFSTLVPLTPTGTRLFAMTVILGVATVCFLSTRWMNALQGTTTVAKLMALAGIVALAFVLGNGADGALAKASLAPQPTGASVDDQASWGRLGVALIAALYAYNGWHTLSYVAGEVRDPGRTYPRAVLAGMAIVLTTYLVVNGAYLYVLSVDALSQSPLVAADVVHRVLGSRGSAVVSALVMVSAFGTLTANVLTQPRLFYAMARDGLFFRQLAAVHQRFHTPHFAIAFIAVTAIALVALRTWDQLRELLIVGAWPFIALAVLAVPVLRRHHPEISRPYRTPGYPFVPLAFVAASLAVLGNITVQHPGSTLASFGFTLLGIPVYLAWRVAHRHHAVA